MEDKLFKTLRSQLLEKEIKIQEEAEKYYTQYLEKFLKPGNTYEMNITIRNKNGQYLVTVNGNENTVSEELAFRLVKLFKDYENKTY